MESEINIKELLCLSSKLREGSQARLRCELGLDCLSLSTLWYSRYWIHTALVRSSQDVRETVKEPVAVRGVAIELDEGLHLWFLVLACDALVWHLD